MFMDLEVKEYRLWFKKNNGVSGCIRINNILDSYFKIAEVIDEAYRKLNTIGHVEDNIYVIYKDRFGNWWEGNAFSPLELRIEDNIRKNEEENGVNIFEKGNVIIEEI